LVEFLIAVILAKFLIISIISLATAAITNTTLASGNGDVFERMIAGSALLVLAAWSPFALLRLIPMMEVAAASITGQRAAIAGAVGSAGIQSPAAYMRQTIDRHTRSSTSPPSAGNLHSAFAEERAASSNGASGRPQGSPATRVDPPPRPSPERSSPSDRPRTTQREI
jgi:hypothetical protein